MVKFAFAGCFGIAFYRVLYVRKTILMMTAVGEQLTLAAVAVGSVLISALQSFVYVTADATGRPGYNTCLGLSFHMQVVFSHF